MRQVPHRSQLYPGSVLLVRAALILLAWAAFALSVPPMMTAFSQLGHWLFWLLTAGAWFGAMVPLIAYSVASVVAQLRGHLLVLGDLPTADFRSGPGGATGPPFWVNSPQEDHWYVGLVPFEWRTRDPSAMVRVTVEAPERREFEQPGLVDLAVGENVVRYDYVGGNEGPVPPQVQRIQVLRYQWLLDFGADGTVVANEKRPIALPIEIRDPSFLGRPMHDLAGTVEIVALSGQPQGPEAPVEGSVRDGISVLRLFAPEKPGHYEIRIHLRTLRLVGELRIPLLVLTYEYRPNPLV